MSFVRKYFIMGSQDCSPDERPVDILQEAIDAGITAFQFREKGEHALHGGEKIALGKELRAVCLKHDVPFIVNDDVELVEVLEADGIHVGQDDIDVAQLRRMFPGAIIGLSISNEAEFTHSQSVLPLIDYIGAGPVYPTISKADAKNAVGLEWIRSLCHKVPGGMPIVGIGGIDAENAADVLAAGADGVAVISAITRSGRGARAEVVRAL